MSWPYYPAFDLVRHSAVFDASNQSMYARVLTRLFPTTIGLWLIWRRWTKDPRDVLALLLLGGLAVYTYGYLRHDSIYGRVLAFIVLVLDVGVGDGIARAEANFDWRLASPLGRGAAVSWGGLLVVGAVTCLPGLVRMVPRVLLPGSIQTRSEMVRPDHEYGFLERYVGPRDVVIGTTARDAAVIPAIAGRTLLTPFAAPFVRDTTARHDAQGEFLDPATPASRRLEIQAEYSVRFVLAHPSDPISARLAQRLEAEGATLAHRSPDFALLRLPDHRDGAR